MQTSTTQTNRMQQDGNLLSVHVQVFEILRGWYCIMLGPANLLKCMSNNVVFETGTILICPKLDNYSTKRRM